MKYKSLALSLTYIKYGESSIISKLFTKEKGLQSFIIKGIRKKKSKKSLNYFSPLKLLSINASYNPKKSLQYIGDVVIEKHIDYTENNMKKKFLACFIAEVGAKVLQENENNLPLFNFMWDTAITLFESKEENQNFALNYLISLSFFLGFGPSKKDSEKSFFNLENGTFSEKKLSKETSLDEENSKYLSSLLNKKSVYIPQKKRSELLKSLLKYYGLHHYNLNGITSHLIIETLRK